VIAAIPFSTAVIIGYVILAIVLPVRPQNLYENEEQEDFWREVTNQPRDLLGGLRHRFRELEMRLQRMEAYVTSKRYDIDRELND
jgi:phage shock protein C